MFFFRSAVGNRRVTFLYTMKLGFYISLDSACGIGAVKTSITMVLHFSQTYVYALYPVTQLYI
jgi:hypothetical protein